MMGANRSLLGLMNGLKKYGVKSIVLCPRKGDFTTALESENIEYIVAPFTNWVYTKVSPNYYLFPLRILQNYIILPRLAKQVAAINPDIIYTNSSVTAVGAYLAHRLGKKHVWHIREFVREHYKTNYVFGQKNFVKWMNRSAAVVSISQALIDGVLNEVTTDKHLIYNGIMSKAQMEKLPEKNPQTKGFTFLNVGLIHPMKQQMQALKAFHILAKKHDNIRLIFVGKGRRIYTWRMRRFCEKNGLADKVSIMGYVPDPSEIYRNADALLMCSLYEGMGRVTAEAMAYSLPVIGYRSGATPELIQHNKNGLLYEGNEHDLAKEMNQLIIKTERAREMGAAGREKALLLFSTDDYVKRIYELILSLS